MKRKKLEGEVEILGHRVEVSRVNRPVLRRVLGTLVEKGFLFAYGDSHTDHTDHNERCKYSDYTEEKWISVKGYGVKWDDQYWDGRD